MLAKARAVLPDTPLTHSDMHEVDFPAASLGAVIAFYSISHTPRELHATLFARIASWLRPGGVFIGNLASRDDPDGFDADWLGAGPMRWSGFDEARNRALLSEAGLTVVEALAIDHVEPEGTKIRPLWFLAQLRRSN
jgi:SAM-dependent methyltransferase